MVKNTNMCNENLAIFFQNSFNKVCHLKLRKEGAKDVYVRIVINSFLILLGSSVFSLLCNRIKF